jgi:hypothetical protein
MKNQKSSSLTSILSPQRGEAVARTTVMTRREQATGSPLLNKEERGRVRS